MIWRLAAIVVCLAGASQAQSVYKVYVPHAGPVSKVETSSAGAGWDVTVSYDSQRCAIACTYRRLRMARLLAPPSAVIRVYTGSARNPHIVIVDPAGLGLPRAAARESTTREQPGLPSRAMLEIEDAMHGDRVPAAVHTPSPIHIRISPSVPAAVPLRI